MPVIFARQALLSTGWDNDVRLEVVNGVIAKIAPQTEPIPGDQVVDTLLPALTNLHSHSFQRFMAGMTEFRGPQADSFWTWRNLMYRFVDRLTPEQIEAAATLVFMEMLEAGYASVGEFHYVHHQKNGAHYDNVTELSMRIFAGAETSGIGLTHLPVLYTYGGAGMAALAGGQLRFGNSVDEYLKLVGEVEKQFAYGPDDFKTGAAPHSLRAIAPDDLKVILAACSQRPIHMHIAEQTKEVDDVQNWLGARPVEWLLANANVDRNWCLIHATHMTQDETIALAKSGSVAGLCPITEANLGDGIFNGADYLNAGGAFGIGSDSNVQIALGGELRMLEYAQRLRHRARNVMVEDQGSVGHALYRKAATGGAQAIGRNAGSIAVGKLADLTAIDSNTPQLCALHQDQLLDGLVFASKDDVVTDVWSAGRHMVRGGKHLNRDEIISRYRKAVISLLAEI